MKRLVVGLPVYNGEKYVDAALSALRSQTYEDFLVVVSDNASTDNTVEIVKHHVAEDDRIILLQQPKNLGAAPNYNLVYREAPASEYFCWVAHDDAPQPEFLERCIEALDADPDAVLAFARTVTIDLYGNEIGSVPPRPPLASPAASVRLSDVINPRSSNEPIFGVMRRAVLDRTHLHGSYTGSDRTLLAEVALQGAFIEVPEPLFAVREHPERSVRGRGAVSGKNREAWFDTSRTGIVFPRWLRVRHYIRAARCAEVSAGERLRCYFVLLCWFSRGNWKSLVFDLRVAARQWVGRPINGTPRVVS